MYPPSLSYTAEPAQSDPVVQIVAPDTFVEEPQLSPAYVTDGGSPGLSPVPTSPQLIPAPGGPTPQRYARYGDDKAPKLPGYIHTSGGPSHQRYARYGEDKEEKDKGPGGPSPQRYSPYGDDKGTGGSPPAGPKPAVQPWSSAAAPQKAPNLDPPIPPVWNTTSYPIRPLPDPMSKANDRAHYVKYLNDVHVLRRKYQVTPGATMLRRGEIFDTIKIKSFYRHKAGRNVGDLLTTEEKAVTFKEKDRPAASVPMLGKDAAQQHQFRHLANEWIAKSLIWVCAQEAGSVRPSFFSHVGKKERFHHSTFTAGEGVIGAGEWIVEKGKLRKISANSGHYRPTLNHLYQAVLLLEEAWQIDTVVLLWNIKAERWDEVPVLDFKRKANQGQYKAHPAG